MPVFPQNAAVFEMIEANSEIVPFLQPELCITTACFFACFNIMLQLLLWKLNRLQFKQWGQSQTVPLEQWDDCSSAFTIKADPSLWERNTAGGGQKASETTHPSTVSISGALIKIWGGSGPVGRHGHLDRTRFVTWLKWASLPQIFLHFIRHRGKLKKGQWVKEARITRKARNHSFIREVKYVQLVQSISDLQMWPYCTLSCTCWIEQR